MVRVNNRPDSESRLCRSCHTTIKNRPFHKQHKEPSSAAERMRKYRLNLRKPENAEKLAEIQTKDKLKKQQCREQQKTRKMTTREKKHQRAEWNRRKRNERKRKKLENLDIDDDMPLSTWSAVTPTHRRTTLQASSSRANTMKTLATKKRRQLLQKERDRSKKAEEEAAHWKKMAERMRKKLERATKQTETIPQNETPEEPDDLTPMKQVKSLLGSASSPVSKANRIKARKALLSHFALCSTTRSRDMQKDNIHISSFRKAKQLLKKYKLMNYMKNVTKVAPKTLNRNTEGRKRRSDAVDDTVKESVIQFYERDDNSRMTTGRKDTKSKNKVVKQKRFLMDSIKNLYEKFTSEFPEQNIGKTKFYNYRPFWVQPPSLKDREQCLCRLHENTQLLADRVFQLKLIPTKDMESLMMKISCDTDSFSCMYGECEECTTELSKLISPEFENNIVQYWQWQAFDNEEGRGTRKAKVSDSVVGLVTKFTSALRDLSKHTFRLRNQYRSLRDLRQNLQEGDAIVHVDFSENYSCKYYRETQAVHFGASHQQVTLHTGMVYAADIKLPFCTIANSQRHDAAAVWAHLEPVLLKIRCDFPLATNIHFFTDGPTSQYRNKTNFHLMSQVPFEMGFTSVKWNFFEAGHGKGAPDGIGAALKRTGDNIVSNGQDITNAQVFFDFVQGQTSVKLFYVKDEKITKYDDTVQDKELRPIPGTMKIHQISVDSSLHDLKHRELSSYCLVSRGRGYDWSNGQTQEKQAAAAEAEESTEVVAVSKEEVEVGNWLAVMFEDRWYPGVVEKYNEDRGFHISFMRPCQFGENRFRWPTPPEKQWMDDLTNTVKFLAPVTVSKRIFTFESSAIAQVENLLK